MDNEKIIAAVRKAYRDSRKADELPDWVIALYAFLTGAAVALILK